VPNMMESTKKPLTIAIAVIDEQETVFLVIPAFADHRRSSLGAVIATSPPPPTAAFVDTQSVYFISSISSPS